MLYFDINDAGQLTTSVKDVSTPVLTVEELRLAVHLAHTTGHSVFCSSAIDFPREFTTDPHVIALCRTLRGAVYEEALAEVLLETIIP